MNKFQVAHCSCSVIVTSRSKRDPHVLKEVCFSPLYYCHHQKSIGRNGIDNKIDNNILYTAARFQAITRRISWPLYFCLYIVLHSFQLCSVVNCLMLLSSTKNRVYTFDGGGLVVTIENCNPALVTASSMLATQVCAYLLSHQCCTVVTSNSTKT